MSAAAADLASGKGHGNENFPVASLLIAPAHREAVMAFYRFARAADDIADNETASSPAKLAALEAMRRSLDGEGADEPTAVALRALLAARSLPAIHAHALLEAFRRDVTKQRYADWDELIDYCRVSAMPVGRYVLDVHGEDRAVWPLSDALCAALQIINHLQDCGEDYRALGRVYLPQDMLAAAGTGDAALAAPRASAELRSVIAACALRCQALLATSAPFARAIRSRRLAMEVAAIQRLAETLAARLAVRDPLSERVHHSKAQAIALALPAVIRAMLRI